MVSIPWFHFVVRFLDFAFPSTVCFCRGYVRDSTPPKPPTTGLHQLEGSCSKNKCPTPGPSELVAQSHRPGRLGRWAVPRWRQLGPEARQPAGQPGAGGAAQTRPGRETRVERGAQVERPFQWRGVLEDFTFFSRTLQ